MADRKRRRQSGGQSTNTRRQAELARRRREAGLIRSPLWLHQETIALIDEAKRYGEDRGAVVDRWAHERLSE